MFYKHDYEITLYEYLRFIKDKLEFEMLHKMQNKKDKYAEKWQIFYESI